MHTEILNKNQVELLPVISLFKRSFYLVGGTAIALHLGHRRSIDFDLFTFSSLNKTRIKAVLRETNYEQIPVFEDIDQLHLVINKVKMTFFNFPYKVEHKVKFENTITFPSLLDLAAMKAFALGRRSKWKDYVDLYFIIKDHFTINEISQKADNIFPNQFSEKLFRQQLAFHKDIDFTEQVEYIIEPVDEEIIKNFLIERAIDIM